MRKFLATLLAGAMVLGLLTACGGGGGDNDSGSEEPTSTDSGEAETGGEAESSGEGLKMTFAWWGNQTRNERTQQVLDMYSEANAGVTFDPQFSDWNDYWTKLSTAAAGNSLPDIIQMDYSYISEYVENGLLADLTPYIEDGTLDVSNVDEGILNSGKIGDGIYAICAGVNVPALLYNKTLLDSAGIEIKDNMTTEEFLNVAREVYEKTGVKTNIGYGTDDYITYFCRAYGEVMYESDKIGTTVEHLQNFYNMYETGVNEGWLIGAEVFAEASSGAVETDPLVYFSSPETQSWCFLAWSNQLSAVKEVAPEDPDTGEPIEIGMTTWPSDDPAVSDYQKPSQFFSISRDAKDPAAAAKVLNYLTNDVDCNNVLLAERGIPISSVVSDAIAPNLTAENQQIIDFINDVVIPNSTTISPPAPAAASECYALNDQLLEEISYGQKTAAVAAQEMFDQGNEFLGG